LKPGASQNPLLHNENLDSGFRRNDRDLASTLTYYLSFRLAPFPFRLSDHFQLKKNLPELTQNELLSGIL
jgi:hypothetical protein